MATETRVFESVDNSPEAKAANAAYFAEQGIEPEVVDSAITGDAATPPAKADEPPAAGAAAPNGAAAADTEVDIAPDAETAADWDSAQTDGRRKSRYARKRQEAKELKAKTEQLERDLAEAKAKAAAPASEPKPGDKAPPAAGSEATPPAAAASDATAEEKFTEVEPVEPKYEDFANEEDQLLAYNKALAKHGREWARWDRRRDNHETKVADKATRQAEQARIAQNERLTQLTVKLAEIRATHPDFNQVTDKGNVFTPALSGVSTQIPGGLEAAYQLAKDPVKLKQFNEMTAETQVVNGKTLPTQRAWDVATYLLTQQAALHGSPAASAPAGSPPAAAPSSATLPREEPAAPIAARGRSADTPGRDNLSGDARRDQLAKQLA